MLLMSALLPTIIIAAERPNDPRAAFVIDHGTHSSLALETASGDLVRYAYGDMRYYALRDTSLASGAAALFLPTPATLGRADLVGPAKIETLRQQLVVGVETIYPLQVAGEKADALLSRLDQLHEKGQAEHISVAAYGLVFSPHPENYFWANNSSTVIAGWLRELEVGIFGWALTASWRVSGA